MDFQEIQNKINNIELGNRNNIGGSVVYYYKKILRR